MPSANPRRAARSRQESDHHSKAARRFSPPLRQIDPFLKLEISMFLGDFEATKEAIRATGRTFDSQDVQTTWVEIETKILKEKIPERIDESPLTYPPRLAAAIRRL